MATIFSETENHWTPVTVAAGGDSPPALGGHARLLPIADGAERGLVLLVEPGHAAFVNGEPLIGQMQVLKHKDELLLDGARHFYSAESKPIVVPFHQAAGQRRPRCPVCRMAIEDGQPVVFCPGCARTFHEIAEAADHAAKCCWTYNTHCRFCQHPTDLGGSDFWTPAEEACHD
jgi:hypothetical protein